jgi:anti-sigma regulatory factor (Ser/Thr protein kinase)
MSDRLALSLSREGNVGARARRFLAHGLRDAGLAELCPNAQLAITELVTNALLHTRGDILVTLHVQPGGVRVAVADESSVPPTPMVGNGTMRAAMSGRGLHLVAALTDAWGCEVAEDGKVVWFEMTAVGGEAGDITSDELLAMWDVEGDSDWHESSYAGLRHDTFEAVLGPFPTGPLVEVKQHSEDLWRELALAAENPRACTSPEVLGLARRLEELAPVLEQARLAIRSRAYAAAAAGEATVTLEVPVRRGTAAEWRTYAAVLDEADDLCARGELLTVPVDAAHRALRVSLLTQLADLTEDSGRGSRILVEDSHLGEATRRSHRYTDDR